jgi:hypothetical protein
MAAAACRCSLSRRWRLSGLFEKLLGAQARQANDGTQGIGRERVVAVNWNRNDGPAPGLPKHVVASFDPDHVKTELLKNANGLSAGEGG